MQISMLQHISTIQIEEMLRKVTFYAPKRKISNEDLHQDVLDALRAKDTEIIEMSESVWFDLLDLIAELEAKLGLTLNSHEEELISERLKLVEVAKFLSGILGKSSILDQHVLQLIKMFERAAKRDASVIIHT